MIHAGTAIEKKNGSPDDFYLERKSLNDGEMKYFSKHEIINADSQMQSIVNEGIDVEYAYLSDRKSLSSLFNAGIQIRKLCKQKKYDLVHVFWGTTTALITILFSPRPVVISFCGSDLLGAKDQKGNITKCGRFSRIISQIAATFSIANITKSEQMRSSLWIFNRKKTTVIPNGVNLKGFYPIAKSIAQKQINFDPNNKYILFFYTEGQVVKNKKLADEVYSIVRKTFPEAIMLYASNIVHEELIYYYNACDVMLLCSFHEGSNNSIKEARACNLPIVSVNAGDARERLEMVDNCFVMGWDAEQLAEKITLILRNQKRSNGENFSKDADMAFIAKTVINLYKKVLQPA